jgi:hypothetical protein
VNPARNDLLCNQLDALDRLFDRDCGVTDVYALTYATACALAGDPLFTLFDAAATALRAIDIRNLPPEEARSAALEATDELRHALAAELP